jgi:ribosome recycling factor
MTVETALADALDRMKKAVSVLHEELGAIRTGRATPAILSRITVDYYGTQVPINQLASFSVPEPRLLVIQPFDKGAISGIEKALQSSDLGLTPSNDGNVIRLSIPELTEERRKELVKIVHQVAEDGRVAVRNIRRDVMHDLRELKKEGDAGSDEEHHGETELQKQTDAAIGEIDSLLKGKEEEILEV